MPRVDRAAVCAGVGCVLLMGVFRTSALPMQLQTRFSHLPAALQHELQARDDMWAGLAPARQQALRQRFKAWDALAGPVRRERRERWQAWRALPTEQRLQVQAAAMAFGCLPAEQQRALRTQFAALDQSERRGWLLGPALGADFVALQPLLLQVPAAQREPLLAALRVMTPAERIDLATLAQRTPPQQRDALRRALLSTSQANRAVWLQSQLDR